MRKKHGLGHTGSRTTNPPHPDSFAAPAPSAPVAAGAIADRSFTVDQAITALDVAADFTGDGMTFALAPSSAALPSGLSLSSAGEITGTPTVTASEVNIVVRGTNSGGFDDTGFGVTIAGAVSSDAVTFGALTLSGEGGIAVSAADGTYGQFTVSGGVITPNTSPLTVGAVTVDGVDVVVEAGRRTVNGKSELLSAIGAGLSAKVLGLRPGVYATIPGDWNGVFNELAVPCRIQAENPNDKPEIRHIAVFSSTATAGYGNVTFSNLKLHRDIGTASKLTERLAGQQEYLINVEKAYPATNIHFENVDMSSDAPVARLTGLRPSARMIGIWVKDGNASNISIRNCTASRLFAMAEVIASDFVMDSCVQSECWDDLLKLYLQGKTVTNITITNNSLYDAIGDHGYHPDIVHISTGGRIVGLLCEGNVTWTGTESHLCPAWPTPSRRDELGLPDGTYVPDVDSLYASNKTLLPSDNNRMIFMDASAATRTVTLFDPSTQPSSGRLCVQAWFTPTNTVVIDANGFTMWNDTLQQNVTSYVLREAWETVQLIWNHVLDRWDVIEARPVIQGFFTNAMSGGMEDMVIRNNIFWLLSAGNGIRIDGANNDNILVEKNSILTPWPGDLLGSGFPNSAANGGPRTQFEIRVDGTNIDATNNIAGASFVGVTATPLGSSNTLSAQVNQTVWADMAAAFPVANAGVQVHMPTTKEEAIAFARPVSGGGVLAGDGALAYLAANDTYNFGQHADIPIGPIVTPSAPSVTATGSLSDRTLTITVDTLTGSPTPTTALTTLTLDGVDVSGDATGTGPWSYDVPGSASSQTVAWTVTATNSEGTDTASGDEVVAANLSADISPTDLVAVYRSGIQEATKTITTTTSASGTHPVLVEIVLRKTSAGSVAQTITGTLNETEMTVLDSLSPSPSNFQIVRLWAESVDVPSGTFDVDLSSSGGNFNGVSVRVIEMANAVDDQSTGVSGTADLSMSTTSRTPSVVAPADSYVSHLAVSWNVMTVSGATVFANSVGGVGIGNTVTHGAHAGELSAGATEDATFTMGAAQQMLAHSRAIV